MYFVAAAESSDLCDFVSRHQQEESWRLLAVGGQEGGDRALRETAVAVEMAAAVAMVGAVEETVDMARVAQMELESLGQE